jgi:hypothetical protein
MKKLEDFIEHLECPQANGIIFPDGTIRLLNTGNLKKKSINIITETGQTSLATLAENNLLHWDSCGVMNVRTDKKLSIEVMAGECSGHGSYGFVAVVELISKKLQWLAFFEWSNPFDRIEIVGKEIHVRSTMDQLWKFNIKDPVKCIVDCR